MPILQPLSEIARTRTSEKWTAFPPDVLPMFVAEMDCALAPPIRAALIDRIDASDTGYLHSWQELAEAFAGFAQRRWGWSVDTSLVRPTTDVSVAIVEVLRQVTSPGDQVVITTPVYPPFPEFVVEAGCEVTEVPLVSPVSPVSSVSAEDGWALDLAGIERAFANGARTLLLCNPHNPLGLVHPAESLVALARLADAWDAVVISDEIHAPLTHPDARFTPFLASCPEAAAVGVTVTAASKAWNIAGTKCALMIGASDSAAGWFAAMPEEVVIRTSILGYHASVAAFRDGEAWLDELLDELLTNRILLGSLLAEHLPLARWREPRASYLAWLDLRAMGWGADPAELLVGRARVALGHGPDFGVQGEGFVRLNFGCAPATLGEGLRRLGAA